MPHVRAALVLLTWVLLLVLGTPGLDFLDGATLQRSADQADFRRSVGEPLATIGIAVARLNREVRIPLDRALGPLQRPFRVSQEWALYRDGPSKVRRLEVWADDELLHRSADPAHAWLAGPLRSRRIRPVVESTCRDTDAVNWRGLARYVVGEARAARPDARRVELRCTAANFPGTDAHLHHAFVATAPTWEAALQ